MPPDAQLQFIGRIRVATIAVLGGSLKQLHETGIAQVRYFGVRSDDDSFSLAGLRYAVAFHLAWQEKRPPPTMVDFLPPGQEEAFQEICRELITQGMLVPAFADYEHQEFRVQLVPPPFDQHWQFVRQLRGGGQSRTSEVLHKSKGTKAVLKVLVPVESETERAAAVERFQREADALLRIENPAVIRPLDFNTDKTKGELGYVTPLGDPLESYWAAKWKSLSADVLYDRAYQLVQSLADGLAAIHEKQLVHRDLKPDNVIMIGEQPVIIDLGLVTNAKYDAIALTEAHGLQVGNHFNPPAVHGLDDADPRRDVAALGWLYGFLLGEPIGGKRRPQRFHWQFHHLVREPRAERARAILAACSLRDSIPRGICEFRAMMDRLLLAGGPQSVPPSPGEASRTKAELIHAEKQAEDALRAAAEKERVDLAVQLFAGPLAELRATLKDQCTGSDALPIVQYDNTRDLDPETEFLLTPGPNIPMDGIMREGYRRVAVSNGEATSSDQRFFYCHCGRERRFKVSATVIYDRGYRENALNFTLHLLCAPDFGDRKTWQDAAYTLHADGQIRNMDNGKVMTPAEIASKAQEWCYAERHWAWL